MFVHLILVFISSSLNSDHSGYVFMYIFIKLTPGTLIKWKTV